MTGLASPVDVALDAGSGMARGSRGMSNPPDSATLLLLLIRRCVFSTCKRLCQSMRLFRYWHCLPGAGWFIPLLQIYWSDVGHARTQRALLDGRGIQAGTGMCSQRP